MDAPILHIELDDEGTPRTLNRRVKVQMIAQMHLVAGETVEAVAEHYGITLADVYAALAYYYDNRADFERRERALQPLAEQARDYTEALKAKIVKRMQQDSAE